MLADMAVNDAEGFANLCKVAQEALLKPAKEVKKENVVVLRPLSKKVAK